jgi:hypothetical protein
MDIWTKNFSYLFYICWNTRFDEKAADQYLLHYLTLKKS